jgi:NitT/TauT family transport system permease protein
VTVAFFPMVINTAVGLRAVEPDLLALTQAMRATRWQVLRKIRFPNAIPYIFAGLKLNASMSVVGAIVGEFVASERGLGAVIMAAGVTLDTPAIFAALILISALGLAIYALVVAAERWLTPWERREELATT